MFVSGHRLKQIRLGYVRLLPPELFLDGIADEPDFVFREADGDLAAVRVESFHFESRAA